MDSQKKRSSGAVDDILYELKGKGAKPAPAGQRSVEEILAEMGLGGDKPSVLAPRPAAKPAAEAPAPAASAPPPPPPQPAAPPVAQAPVQPAPPPPEAPPAPPLERTAEFQVTTPTPPPAPTPARPARPAADKKRDTGPSIWDISVDKPAQPPRLGKAAALDRVDPDKYTGDTELLSWFSDETDLLASKKDQKKAAKLKKKEQATQRRELKHRGEEEESSFFDTPQPEDDAFDTTSAWPDTPPDETDAWQPPLVDSFAPPEAAATSAANTDAPADPGTLFASISSTQSFSIDEAIIEEQSTVIFTAVGAAAQPAAEAPAPEGPPHDTRSYDLPGDAEAEKVPTAAYTQEFDSASGAFKQVVEGVRSLYVDDMVDDRFREFFSETVIVDKDDIDQAIRAKKRKHKKSRSAILTGEFAKLAEMAEQAEQAETGQPADPALPAAEDEWEDYDRPQDADAIEKDIVALRTTLSRRTVATAALSVLLFLLGLAHSGVFALPAALSPVAFAVIYLVLFLAAMAVNFTTVATGLIGLVGEPTVDTAPALASVAGLLQAIVLLVNALSGTPAAATLFGVVAALLLTFNALGKRVRAVSILRNFQLASAGFDHSAAYVLDGGQDVAQNITSGLEEDYPTLLVSRPTALVKGFLRQSFSQRWTDRVSRIVGWVLLGVALAMALITYFLLKDLFAALSAFAALLCIAAPLSSTLVSAVPSLLLQVGTSRIGAVVPGWSAIEELGQVNVVMAGARDIFPPASVTLRGIKTFEKERIDIAILYAASVLIEGCDTLRDIFLGVIQGKSDMLYKVESLVKEPGRGFNAWVENNRVVIGNREMLQKHGVTPPPVEIELKYVPEGHFPVYLAVAGRLTAMFIVGYQADGEVAQTLDGLIKSGVSLLVTSDDMNVTGELIEQVYNLPRGVIKVLGPREMEILKPLTAYLPESDGVMTHMGTFASFIGGMRAAAGCAASEKMSAAVQIASSALAVVLCALLVFSSSLPALSITIPLLYQAGWTLLVCALPLTRRY